MTPLLLALLAIVDAAFAGFRAAAGRNARIFKFAYYRQSVLRGAWAGVVLVVALGVLTLLALVMVPSPHHQYAELVVVGTRMLGVLGAYAALVIGGARGVVSCAAVVLLGRALDRWYARRSDVLQKRHSPPTPAIGPP